ncbi:hypothetical protein SEA_KEELAN_76 [Gordonia phage Keelan]|nr:hypothetical protein SEA_KEELAN_76 [Gordonia phage Keelan]
MKVEVTQADIDRSRELIKEFLYGDDSAADCCPISLAIQRKQGVELATVGPRRVIVGRAKKPLSTTGTYMVYSYYGLPKRAKEFVERFDKGVEVQPITFEARKRRKLVESSRFIATN